MKLELAPIVMRRIRPSAVESYRVYLDTLIGMKLREWDRVKESIVSPKSFKRAIA